MTARWTLAATLCLGLVGTLACGSKSSPTGPTNGNTGVQVTAVTPNSGTTLGGTAVTITGAKFAAGATVTIGGAAASNVTVSSDTSLTATTAQHASGAADVVVTVGTQSATLHGGFTFSAPPKQDDQPPVIASITATGPLANEPKQFSNVGENVSVVATVTDDNTPVDQLDYQWSSAAGSIIGSGPSVHWQAPGAAGPVDLTLTVVEHYQTTDDSGLPVTKDNKTTKTVTINVHDSYKEVGDLAYEFLLEFSRQNPGPDQVVRDFSPSCPGKSAERDDVAGNQANRIIQSYKLGSPDVHVSFGDTCRNRGRFGDACAYVSCEWHSLVKGTGQTETTIGTDQVNAIFDGSRWWLCDSDFFGTRTNP